ncbi:helix-turn-helix domain-containing protein [Ignavigranum ruoffiae]|uniref:Transcriptional regulator, contains XRE-family HTH domain n=1 Tax=Ignavigranum ruoffiae TaxID=89093 RepID=A0A1H9H7F9_9LACT|nr:helix-turn-helix transcriptional regulator [Ignavigranum ruoffiae]SEQ58291.1 Transcriptional regulator, contains XRE-family HTH domain [Ignavigranum ruoffiae]
MNVGQRIANLRTDKNLSQAEFSKCIGVSQSTVGLWETDQRNIPTQTLVKVADFFNVSTDYLLGHKIEDKNNVDLRQVLRENSTMNFGGLELSDKDKEAITRVIGAMLGGD